jgi:hypothetical protein
MLDMADLAVQQNVDLLVVGTELVSTQTQEDSWRLLIEKLRNKTKDQNIPFVYASNWDPGPVNVKFWDTMDYIGVDAYYPLATTANSSVDDLRKAWRDSPKNGDIIESLSNLSATYSDKPILFTEIGYTTTDACAVGNHAGGNRSMQAQANAYEAFFAEVYGNEWFHGVFFWDWEVTSPQTGGRCDGGAFSFTPSGKLAEKVMSAHFLNSNNNRTPYVSVGTISMDLPKKPYPLSHNIDTTKALNSVIIYSNGILSHEWQDWSYNGQTNLQCKDVVMSEETYSAFGTFQDFGAMSFHSNNHLDADNLKQVSFAIHSSPLCGNEIQVALYGTKNANTPFAPRFVNHYTSSCDLSVDNWTTITIPIQDLLPPTKANGVYINRIEFKANYHTGVGNFWLDKLTLG